MAAMTKVTAPDPRTELEVLFSSQCPLVLVETREEKRATASLEMKNCGQADRVITADLVSSMQINKMRQNISRCCTMK